MQSVYCKCDRYHYQKQIHYIYIYIYTNTGKFTARTRNEQ